MSVVKKYTDLASYAQAILPGKEEFGDLLVWLNQNGHSYLACLTLATVALLGW